MELYIIKHQVINLNLEQITTALEEENNKKSLSFDYDIQYLEEDLFVVIFKLLLEHSCEFKIDITYATYFKTSKEITIEFKESDFPLMNAPAIGFPFLRSFIATLTINAGYEGALIPSINFVSLAEEKKAQLQSKVKIEKNNI
jgi:preprotein translocase subunit SecB